MSRAKRDQKKREKLRQQDVRVHHRLSNVATLLECRINSNWKHVKLANLRMIWRLTGGGHASAAFLIDLSCLGLKDVYGDLQASYQGFMDAMDRAPIDMEPCDLGLARQLVAGSVLWARRHGFALPQGYERWTALLGELPAQDQIDLSGFGNEGGLHYLGTRKELARRYTRGPLSDLLEMPGFRFTFEESQPADFTDEAEYDPPQAMDDDPIEDALPEDQKVLNELVDVIEMSSAQLTRDLKHYCAVQGIEPNPQLAAAARLFIGASLVSLSQADENGENNSVIDHDWFSRYINTRIAQLPEDMQPDTVHAMNQIFHLMRDMPKDKSPLILQSRLD